MNRLNLTLMSEKADALMRYRLHFKKDELQGLHMDSSRTKKICPKYWLSFLMDWQTFFQEARTNEISKVAYSKCDMKIKRPTIMLMKKTFTIGMSYQSWVREMTNQLMQVIDQVQPTSFWKFTIQYFCNFFSHNWSNNDYAN